MYVMYERIQIDFSFSFSPRFLLLLYNIPYTEIVKWDRYRAAVIRFLLVSCKKIVSHRSSSLV